MTSEPLESSEVSPEVLTPEEKEHALAVFNEALKIVHSCIKLIESSGKK